MRGGKRKRDERTLAVAKGKTQGTLPPGRQMIIVPLSSRGRALQPAKGGTTQSAAAAPHQGVANSWFPAPRKGMPPTTEKRERGRSRCCWSNWEPVKGLLDAVNRAA